MCYKDLTSHNMDAEVLEDVCNVIYTLTESSFLTVVAC